MSYNPPRDHAMKPCVWIGSTVGPLVISVMPALMTLASPKPLGAQEPPRYAGPTAQGFLLPNGWTITPAGTHIPLTDLPLNILPLAGGRHALVATSGYNAHELSVVDLAGRKVV